MIILKENKVNVLNGRKHIHFIGIGGSGMYPLAQILHSQGYYLTGSDNNETETLEAVRKMGIPVFLGQRAENIEGADLIVHTAAIMADNPELIAAKASGVPVLERSELLGIVTSWYDNAVCVSGTHGKTTTTAYATHILKSINFNGGSIYGSFLLNSDIYNNSGKNLLIEACEYKDHFNLYSLDGLVITNIEYDHPDYFSSLEDVKSAFHKRVLGINQKGFVICHKSIYSLVSSWLLERCDIKLIAYSDSTFKINGEGEYEVSGINSEMSINIKADVVAALLISALMLLKENNLEINSSNILEIVNSLKKYVLTLPTVASRSEIVAEKNNIKLICDYAHHPTEIKTCIDNIILQITLYNQVFQHLNVPRTPFYGVICAQFFPRNVTCKIWILFFYYTQSLQKNMVSFYGITSSIGKNRERFHLFN